MHPNGIFEWTEREAMLAFLGETAFATIVVLTPSGARIAHAPLLVCGEDRLRFHLSRRNAAADAESARALVSCIGPHAYLSPDWYGTSDQVPTWNYLAVECEGGLTRLPDGELAGLVDALSAVHEARLRPKPSWTSAKMSPGRFEAMLQAIVGFELRIEALRGTRKLGQNKRAEEMAGACAGLRGAGQHEMAALIEAAAQ